MESHLLKENILNEISKEQLQRLTRKGSILLHNNERPYILTTPRIKTTELFIIHHTHLTFYQRITISSSISTASYRAVFNKQVVIENAFLNFIDSRIPELYATGKNKLVTFWQNI